ncbi:MAG: hypothetical protein HYX61_06010 [Gammaproteobacteria bacterium]|jgi:hypothetical protein|nr:hypothetical protein [Gammaproteobacteria bacterium]
MTLELKPLEKPTMPKDKKGSKAQELEALQDNIGKLLSEQLEGGKLAEGATPVELTQYGTVVINFADEALAKKFKSRLVAAGFEDQSLFLPQFTNQLSLTPPAVVKFCVEYGGLSIDELRTLFKKKGLDQSLINAPIKEYQAAKKAKPTERRAPTEFTISEITPVGINEDNFYKKIAEYGFGEVVGKVTSEESKEEETEEKKEEIKEYELTTAGRVYQEILLTERDYINDLRRIGSKEQQAYLEVYNSSTDKSNFLSEAEFKQILDLYSQFSILHEEILKSLEKDPTSIERFLPIMREMYSKYVPLFHKMGDIPSDINNVYTSNPAFRNLGLRDFLIKPVQRIAKYPLLIREFAKEIPEDHILYARVRSNLVKVPETVDAINSRLKSNQLEQSFKAVVQSYVQKPNLNSFQKMLNEFENMRANLYIESNLQQPISPDVYNLFRQLDLSNAGNKEQEEIIKFLAKRSTVQGKEQELINIGFSELLINKISEDKLIKHLKIQENPEIKAIFSEINKQILAKEKINVTVAAIKAFESTKNNTTEEQFMESLRPLLKNQDFKNIIDEQKLRSALQAPTLADALKIAKEIPQAKGSFPLTMKETEATAQVGDIKISTDISGNNAKIKETRRLAKNLLRGYNTENVKAQQKTAVNDAKKSNKNLSKEDIAKIEKDILTRNAKNPAGFLALPGWTVIGIEKKGGIKADFIVRDDQNREVCRVLVGKNGITVSELKGSNVEALNQFIQALRSKLPKENIKSPIVSASNIKHMGELMAQGVYDLDSNTSMLIQNDRRRIKTTSTIDDHSVNLPHNLEKTTFEQRFQKAIDNGLIPRVVDKTAESGFENQGYVSGKVSINTSDPFIAIKQYEAALAAQMTVTLGEKAKEAIKKGSAAYPITVSAPKGDQCGLQALIRINLAVRDGLIVNQVSPPAAREALRTHLISKGQNVKPMILGNSDPYLVAKNLVNLGVDFDLQSGKEDELLKKIQEKQGKSSERFNINTGDAKSDFDLLRSYLNKGIAVSVENPNKVLNSLTERLEVIQLDKLPKEEQIEQVKMLAKMGICGKIKMEAPANTLVPITSNNAQRALKTFEELLNQGFRPKFDVTTLNLIKQSKMLEIRVSNPDPAKLLDKINQCFEIGLKVQITDDSKRMLSDYLRKNPKALPDGTLQIKGFNPHAIRDNIDLVQKLGVKVKCSQDAISVNKRGEKEGVAPITVIDIQKSGKKGSDVLDVEKTMDRAKNLAATGCKVVLSENTQRYLDGLKSREKELTEKAAKRRFLGLYTPASAKQAQRDLKEVKQYESFNQEKAKASIPTVIVSQPLTSESSHLKQTSRQSAVLLNSIHKTKPLITDNPVTIESLITDFTEQRKFLRIEINTDSKRIPEHTGLDNILHVINQSKSLPPKDVAAALTKSLNDNLDRLGVRISEENQQKIKALIVTLDPDLKIEEKTKEHPRRI